MINIDALDLQTLIAGLVAVIVVMGSGIIYLNFKEKERGEEEPEEENEELDEAAGDQDTRQQVAKGKGKKGNDRNAKKQTSYDHPWCLTTLKGHTSQVTGIDFAQDGKKFASVSTDRNAFIWKVADFTAKEHMSSRQLLDFDTASKVAFAPDSKSVVFSMKRDNKLAVYKMAKNTSGAVKLVHAESVEFPSIHKLDISAMGIASTGKFLMTSSPDMKIVIYDIRGEVLKCLEPKVSSLFDCTISPDGRFVSIAGFTPDVFVYEPTFNRNGDFVDCKRAFDLTGHSSGVFSVAFNQDGSRAVTVSRDGFWRVFDTDIRYAQGQDSKVLRKGEWSSLKAAAPDRVKLAVSPSGGSIAIAVGTTLRFFSSEDVNMEFPEMLDVHASAIECMRFSPCGKWLATCGDKYIRVFHNVPEFHSQIVRLENNLPQITGEAARRRIQDQIEEARENLSKFV